MPLLGSVRGRTAFLLTALMLSVAALGLIAVYHAMQPPAPSAWEALLSSTLNDPLLSGSSLFGDPTASDPGLLGAVGGDGLLLIAVWLALVPVTARLGWVLAGRMTRPLEEAADVAEAAGPGRPRRPAGRHRPDEYGRLHEALDGLLDRFDRHESERRRLIDDTAHEIRNPLAAMRTSLEVALEGEAGPGELRAAAAVAQRAGERIAHSIDELQAGSRDGASGPIRTVVDLAAVAGELARDHAPAAARRGIEIHVVAPAGLMVVADRDGLRRALENLLVNAIRFAPPGSPVVVGAGALPGWRWLGVRDFGPGIAAADQPLVFARGWRGGGPDAGVGSGIGLALVRQVAEAHRGVVRLSSVPRAGASFVMWLPAVEPDGRPAVRVDTQPDPLWAPPRVAVPPSAEAMVVHRQATLPV